MRIKKHKNGNIYLMTPQGKWVRDFTKQTTSFVDINKTITNEDHFVFLQNEIKNNLQRNTWIDSENIKHSNIIIVSDGFDFQSYQEVLNKLSKDIIIIGVNGSLVNWSLKNRNINYYLINNPYKGCMKYLPRRKGLMPKCVFSCRTNHEFISNYNGTKFKYYPTNESNYIGLGKNEVKWEIDDYRNSICAAIGLAYRFGVEKLLLLCCDDSFKEERTGSIKLENGLWMYPQQEISHGLIEGNLFWLKNQEYYDVSIADCSSGPKYNNALNIKKEEILSFFEIEEKNEQKD